MNHNVQAKANETPDIQRQAVPEDDKREVYSDPTHDPELWNFDPETGLNAHGRTKEQEAKGWAELLDYYLVQNSKLSCHFTADFEFCTMN